MSLYIRQTLAPILSLFTSAGTLICCALPALFITLGMGATFAGLVANFPQLIWFSAHKGWIFAGAAAMLLVSAYLRWRSRNDPCPVDPIEAKACARIRAVSGILFWFSVSLYLTGVFFAYIAPKLI